MGGEGAGMRGGRGGVVGAVEQRGWEGVDRKLKSLTCTRSGLNPHHQRRAILAIVDVRKVAWLV